MQVAATFLENRLQAGQTALIYAPPHCVDFNPPLADQTTGFSNV